MTTKKTLICLGCSFEMADSTAKPGQKYPSKCFNCGRTALENKRHAEKIKRRADRAQRNTARTLSLFDKPPVKPYIEARNRFVCLATAAFFQGVTTHAGHAGFRGKAQQFVELSIGAAEQLRDALVRKGYLR